MSRIIVSALTTFVIITGLAFIGAVYVFRRAGETLDWTTAVVCVLLGAIAMAQDIRASYRMPPIRDVDSLRQLLKVIEKQTKDENKDNKLGDS